MRESIFSFDIWFGSLVERMENGMFLDIMKSYG